MNAQTNPLHHLSRRAAQGDAKALAELNAEIEAGLAYLVPFIMSDALPPTAINRRLRAAVASLSSPTSAPLRANGELEQVVVKRLSDRVCRNLCEGSARKRMMQETVRD